MTCTKNLGRLLPAVLLLMVGCGGDGTVTGLDDDDGGGGGDVVERSIKADPSLATDVWEIFVRRGCTSVGCHGGGAGGLTLDQAANAYTNLVNVQATTGEILVIPGDADQSYLVKRLDGRISPRMPLNSAALDGIDLTNIKNWINQGAGNN